MKLRAFSTEETKQLISDMDRYWELCQLITQEAKAKIIEGHAAQLRDYTWSWKRPFSRPIKDIEDMTYKMTGGQFRATYYDFIVGKGFTEYLSSWMGDADPHYDFVQVHFNNLLTSASVLGSWKRDDVHVFHELVEKYAEHPLIPDASDIEMIKIIRNRLEILESMWSDYNNAV